MNDEMNERGAEGPVSRRGILGRLSLAAVGGGALAATGVAFPGRASADDGDDLWLGHYNSSSSVTVWDVSGGATGLSVSSVGDSAAIKTVSTYVGLWGQSFGRTGYDNVVSGEHVGVLGSVDATCGHDRIGVRGIIASGNGGTGVEGISRPYGYGVAGLSDGGFGVYGAVENADGVGVGGIGPATGVKGEATTPGGVGVRGVGADGGTAIRGHVPNYGYALRGKAGAGFGVLGEVTNGIGVAGDSTNNGWGVKGTAANGGWGVQGISDTSCGVRGDSTGGTGVRGESQTDVGVYGRSTNQTGVLGYGGAYGLIGQCDAGGVAVDGTSSNGGVGVYGRSLPTGYGVRGESSSGFGVRGDAVTGIAVSGNAAQGTGVSGQGKLGGEFRGTRAALRLTPTAYAGSPPTGRHLKGDLICDKDGNLWFCKGDGTPGTWVQIA